MLKFFKRHLLKNSSERWDMKYSNGEWEGLRQIHELGHYSILAGYFQYLKPGGSLLDVGCGEGLLQERISESFYSRYVGIDHSAAAIEKALPRRNAKTEFTVAGFSEYFTDEKFDAIIFNESLYYVSQHVKVIKRYADFLNEKGILILSNFENQDNKLPWEEIERHFPKLDETRIINAKGSASICKVLMKL